MQFVQKLLNDTRHYESPSSFWKWAGYSAIAGVLRDNVWMSFGDSKIFPNIYVVFLAGSGQRKGAPIGEAETLVTKVNNVKTISGRSSIQAILIEIGQTETDADGKIKKGGAAIFFAPELSAGIVADEQSIQILTDIYDYRPSGHTTNLIGRGKARLDKLIFSMVGGSNEELLKSVYTSKAVNGGLLGRTFLVVPDEFRPSNAFPEGNETRFQDRIKSLREISHLGGEMVFEPMAKEFYRIWYEGDQGFRKKSSHKDDRTGLLGRMGTNVKKMSMILAANDLCHEINVKHVEQAIHECLSLIPNYSPFTYSSGKSTIAECGAIVLETLAKGNGDLHSRKSFIRDHWFNFDPETLDKAVGAFETAGIIRSIVASGEILFELTQRGKDIVGK